MVIGLIRVNIGSDIDNLFNLVKVIPVELIPVRNIVSCKDICINNIV